MAESTKLWLNRAPIKIGWLGLPAATGGPNTHLAGGPNDHQLFKGDWLHYSTVRDGKLQFVGLFESCEP